jgi:hypothetical protein
LAFIAFGTIANLLLDKKDLSFFFYGNYSMTHKMIVDEIASLKTGRIYNLAYRPYKDGE